MTHDIARRLIEVTFQKGRQRGGLGGQTIECSMRSTFHEVSQWDLTEAADRIEQLEAALDEMNQTAEIAHYLSEGGQQTPVEFLDYILDTQNNAMLSLKGGDA